MQQNGDHQRRKSLAGTVKGLKQSEEETLEDVFIRLVGRSIEDVERLSDEGVWTIRRNERGRDLRRIASVDGRRFQRAGPWDVGVTVNGLGFVSATFRVMFIEEGRKSVEFAKSARWCSFRCC